VVAVYSEADSGPVYAGLPQAGGLAKAFKTAPCVNAVNIPVPCATAYGYYGRKKLDAKAGSRARCFNAANIPVPCAAPFGYGLKKLDAEANADAR
jgi:hypothetical protein